MDEKSAVWRILSEILAMQYVKLQYLFHRWLADTGISTDTIEAQLGLCGPCRLSFLRSKRIRRFPPSRTGGKAAFGDGLRASRKI